MENDQLTSVLKLNNGLILNNKFLPVEILARIFENFDERELLSLQTVCKSWEDIIKRFIWYKKAQVVFELKFTYQANLTWDIYHAMTKMAFGRNLIKNHSGEHELKHWEVEAVFYPDFIASLVAENTYWPSPEFPDDPVFEGKKRFFLSGEYAKTQLVDLIASGYSSKFLDIIQPQIEVSVWITGTEESFYRSCISIHNKNFDEVDSFEYAIQEREDLSDDWHKICFTFSNYGPGVSYVRFRDTGRRQCKIAGICVKILPPKSLPKNFVDAILDVISNMKKWHAKASSNFDISIPFKPDIPCDVYHLMSFVIFKRNLVKNHSAAEGLMHWTTYDGCCPDTWSVGNSIYDDLSLSKNVGFRIRNDYFICGYGIRSQEVFFEEEGYTSKFMDIIQPPIEVSVWFSCPRNAYYRCCAILHKEDNSITEELTTNTIIELGNWKKVRHIFENYGTGVKSIKFSDFGTPNEIKIIKSTIQLLPPITIPDNYEEAFL